MGSWLGNEFEVTQFLNPGNLHCILGNFHSRMQIAGAAADTAVVEALNPCLAASCHYLDFLESFGLDSWRENRNYTVVVVVAD